MVMGLLAAVAFGADARIAPGSTSLAVGQSMRVSVFVQEGQPRSRPDLVVPDGLVADFVSQGRSFRSNGRGFMEVSQYDYTVTAVRTGLWAVGPVVIPLSDGSIVTAPLVAIEVGDRSAVGSGPTLSATARFDGPTAWEGEVVVYSTRVVARAEVSDVTWRLADAGGLRRAGGEDNSTGTSRIDDPAGPIVTFDASVAMTATGRGTVSVPPSLAELTVPTGRSDFFGLRSARRDRVATNPVSLDVLPLPPPPPDFSGLVGDFAVVARLDRATARVGDSVEFSVQLSGDGLLEGFTPPPIPNLKGARVYDGETLVRGSLENGTFRRLALVRRSIVPTEPGVLQLPAVSWTVFSPTEGKYVTLRAAVSPLVVSGVAESASVQSFLSEDPPDVAVAPDPVPKAHRGSALGWRLGRALPVVAALGVLPGVFGALRAFAAWMRRPKPVELERPATAAELLVALPTDPESRLARLDAALRAALKGVAEEEAPDLARQARLELDRARYADGSDPEAIVRRAVAALEHP